MSKFKICIITGTEAGKLYARVEQILKFGFNAPFVDSFSVTIGGEKWKRLDKDLRQAIINRAEDYVTNLQQEVDRAVNDAFATSI